jgi:hypothetical protein
LFEGIIYAGHIRKSRIPYYNAGKREWIIKVKIGNGKKISSIS